jgi:hypothetical protein
VLPGECTEAREFEWVATKCADGACGLLPDTCGPCDRPDGEGGCEVGPREGCLTSLEPRRSSLLFVDGRRQTGDKFRWKWRDGMSFDPLLLGNPGGFTGMQVCVFDESAATPQLVFSTYWNTFPAADPEHEWMQRGEDLRFQRDTYAGKETVSWSASNENRSSLLVQGRGGNEDVSYDSGLADGVNFDQTHLVRENIVAMPLPHAPLGLPLRVQARMDFGGACFESVFGEDGVKKNADGKFSAKATQ